MPMGEGQVREEVVMDSQSLQPGAYEAQHAQANRAELIERVAQATREDGRVEPLNGLYLFRASSPTELLHSVYTPAFCVIAQGSKEVFLGEFIARPCGHRCAS